MKYLNLGCGNCYHNDWINIDLHSNDPHVLIHDLRQGIPFPGESFDVVYHSNIIEHFRREDALIFMKECFRVLKPGGILRVATPDLEQICKIYLETLHSLKKGNLFRDSDYEWIMLEMYDQTVREKSGGQMLSYLHQNPIPNEDFVLKRIGEEGEEIIRPEREFTKNSAYTSQVTLHNFFKYAINKIRKFQIDIFLPLCIGSSKARAFKIGHFRLSGEVHQWMYDSYSLSKLIESAGFIDPIKQTALESQIPDWTSFHLDTLSYGRERKPDSFYMEARKIQK